jgi:S-DNA-T family DNA segregation ATPase FtsK/SpoIIIE
MTVFLQKFRRDIVGIVYLAGGLFLGLALVSFRASDPSFNSVGMGLEVHNYCGYIGSFLADLLYQIWGIPAWVLVAASLQMAYRSFRGRDVNWSLSRIGWGLLLLVTVSSLLALHFPEKHILGERVHIAGLVGTIVTKGLVAAFNFLGVLIILWSLALVLLVFYTERSLRDLSRTPTGWLKFAKPILQKLAARSSALATFFQPKAAAVGGMNVSFGERQETAGKEEKKFRFALPALVKSKSSTEDVEESDGDTDEGASETEPEEKEARSFLSDLKVARRKVKLKAKIDRHIENWKLPELGMLEDPPASRIRVDEREILRKSEILTDKLAQFSVCGEVKGAKPGPAVTMYEFKPNADVKISKITDLADDLSLALSSESVRIIAPIPGRDVVGIETSNSSRETVYLKDILANDQFWSDKVKLPLALGRQADGDPKVVDLRKMPHLMVAGTTGSGKSVFVVSVITGLLFRHSPKSLRLILIDPKQVDLAAFGQIPHLLMPPIREPKKAVTALKWAIREMEKRYRSMSRFGARGIESFNEIVEKLPRQQIEGHEAANLALETDGHKLEQYYFTSQPYIVIVVEEFGDLMAVDKVNVEQSVVRLAQMARACGIHLILAMQSPRKDVVTGLIKTNIPGRISFKVASKMDSRIILDDSGAERLLAQGDMLFLAPGVSKPLRHHGAWVTEAEISAIMKFWSDQGEPQFDPLAMKALEGTGGGFDFGGTSSSEDGGDPLAGPGEDGDSDDKYDEVLAYVSTLKDVSASLLQRRFKLGYPRAARMIETFEKEGVVGPANGSKPRRVLISSYRDAE